MIYIPLCLYFNPFILQMRRKPEFTFTFHYVSILMLNEFVLTHADDKFTFHYVSILICSGRDSGHRQLNLHSIMSLF